MTACAWAQLGSNQRPPDYESGAANHLSYGPENMSNLPGHPADPASDPPDTVCRDAANHLSYGPEITGCKYNIKLIYLQTKIICGGGKGGGRGFLASSFYNS